MPCRAVAADSKRDHFKGRTWLFGKVLGGEGGEEDEGKNRPGNTLKLKGRFPISVLDRLLWCEDDARGKLSPSFRKRASEVGPLRYTNLK